MFLLDYTDGGIRRSPFRILPLTQEVRETMLAPVDPRVAHRRVAQPFPHMPSFLPAAVVLSYFGYSHESWLLL